MKNKLQYYVKYAIIGMEIYIFTINAMLFGILHIKGGFKMEQKEMKKVVKRVVKKVLKETYYKEFFDTLLTLIRKANAESCKEFEDIDISAITKKSCSETEVCQIVADICEKLKKELRKKHTYFVTTKIVQALWAFDEEVKDSEMYNDRVRFCYEYIKLYEGYLCEEYDKALKHVSLLD